MLAVPGVWFDREHPGTLPSCKQRLIGVCGFDAAACSMMGEIYRLSLHLDIVFIFRSCRALEMCVSEIFGH